MAGMTKANTRMMANNGSIVISMAVVSFSWALCGSPATAMPKPMNPTGRYTISAHSMVLKPTQRLRHHPLRKYFIRLNTWPTGTFSALRATSVIARSRPRFRPVASRVVTIISTIKPMVNSVPMEAGLIVAW